MANLKISDYTELAGVDVDAALDRIEIMDESEPAGDNARNKFVTVTGLRFALVLSGTVAGLVALTGIATGQAAFASDGRRSGEGVGAGSGCPVWYDGTDWRTFYDNTVAAA